MNSEPLVEPCSYDPSFKVDIRSHEPLWCCTLTSSDVLVEMCALLSQLESICRKETEPITQPVGKRKRHYSNTFQTHGMVLIERMTNLLQKASSPVPNLLEYLERNGCGTLFPRAVSYVTNPHAKITPIKQAPMDGHFNQASTLNQLIALCYQLQHDITSLSNHKYIAHQIALVYQSINQLGNPKVLLDHRTSIETTFKKIKAELEREGEPTPHLNSDLIFWLQNLTSSLVQSVKSLSADLTGQMRPAMKFILHSTS